MSSTSADAYINEEYQQIQAQLKEVSRLADEHLHIATFAKKYEGSVQPGPLTASRDQLMLQAWKLYHLAAGPTNVLINHHSNTTNVAAIRALLERGIFDKMPSGRESITADELSSICNIEKDLLVRLMRSATIFGPFAEVGEEKYAHTPFSEAYLNMPLRELFQVMQDEHMPVQAVYYEYFNHNGWRDPQSLSDTPYAYGHKTGGKILFEHISNMPERLRRFNNCMAGASKSHLWHIEIFPWAEQLSLYQPKNDSVLVVDVGGGHGNASRHIRQLCKNIPGKIVIQDRPEALNSIKDLPDGVETMQHDFFKPNPIKGAHIYLIRRCLHNWPDKESSQILAAIAKGIVPGKSRILIQDCIVPVLGTEQEVPWKDISMMSFSSGQRTLKQWEKICDWAGLKISRTWTAPGTAVGVIEAYLKDSSPA